METPSDSTQTGGLMPGALFEFPGGVHPPEHKQESTRRPVHPVTIPPTLVIPLRQHIGAPARPVVEAGQRVRAGECIGVPDGGVSAAVHAGSSGTVVAVEPRPVPHPSGLPDLCVVIETDGKDEWIERTPIDPDALPRDALIDHLRAMGLAGLGGAAFPSAVKLAPPAPCPTLILNGGECEPWITCDDLLMRTEADQILDGVALMRRLLGSTTVLVGIEDNKPEALQAMRTAAARLDFPVEVIAVPTRYPAGGIKQMIQTLTGLEVPSGKLPTDLGIQVFNVGTAYALARAIRQGEPLVERLVTVTGHVLRPQNFRVRIGTPMHWLVGLAGEREGATGLRMGGPMMGLALARDDLPVVKATNCILVESAEIAPPRPPALPCIRCGRCAAACPVRLLPHELFRFAKAGEMGRAQEYHLFDCIECGCCSYVCPSHIPLVEFYRYAKSEIWAKEREKRAADRAREQHEFRLARLEREKREKAEKLAAKAAAKRAELAAADEGGAPANDAEAKKALIAAALARAQAKKATVTPKNTEALTPEQAAEIAAIEARRAEIRAIARQPVDSESP